MNPNIFEIFIMSWLGGSTINFSKSPDCTSLSYSSGLSSFNLSKGCLPKNTTVSKGKLSGLKCVWKKWKRNINPTAKSASSAWITAAILSTMPGRKCEKNSGNHKIKPENPITGIPQNTAK